MVGAEVAELRRDDAAPDAEERRELRDPEAEATAELRDPEAELNAPLTLDLRLLAALLALPATSV